MKNLLLPLFLILSLYGNAQNYNVLRLGAPQYFINNLGYLRGIRVDSVSSSGSDSIFHLFHSPRYCWLTTSPTYAYPFAGSWVGLDVVKHNDGTYSVSTIGGDTLYLKTQAIIGDSWNFTNSAAIKHYRATLTAIDTVSILGDLDSVKTITISAYLGSTINPSDSINNFQIQLTKNHGFAQLIDLYTFPYLEDTFELSPASYDAYTFSSFVDGPDLVSANNALFRQVKFHYPTGLEVFDLHLGDVSGYSQYNREAGYITTYQAFAIDSMTEKLVLDSFHVRYSYSELGQSTNYYNWMYGPTVVVTSNLGGGGVFYADSAKLFYSDKMPEEVGNDNSVIYLPSTNSCGFVSSYYRTYFNPTPKPVEYCQSSYSYKVGMMPLGYHTCSTSPGASFPYDQTTDFYRSYYKVNGASCGTWSYSFLDASSLNQDKVNIYPNPANEVLTIETQNTQTSFILLSDMLGSAVYSTHTTEKKTAINTSVLSPGVYMLTITNDSGEKQIQKLIVTH